jgi:hypothetical protein
MHIRIINMSKKLISTTLIAMTLLTGTTILSAQEGARSVGKGLKCSQRLVPQADGTVKLQQVCYKSI